MSDVAEDLASRNFIGGKWEGAAGGTYTRRAPLGTEDLGPYPESDATDVEVAVRAAADAFPGWAATPAPQRAAILHALAALIEEHAEELARTITLEEGKPLTEALGETSYSVRLLRYHAELPLVAEGSVLAGSVPGSLNLERRRPLGPVALITPWNFPLLVPIRKLAPALAYGNTVVLKPSEESPQTAIDLLRLIDAEALLPPGVLNLVCGHGAVGGALVTHPEIRGVSFTGSTPTGRAVQARAMDRERRIPVQAEMGGKNVLLVAADADPDRAVRIAVEGGLKGGGQRCTCTGLIMVDRSVAEDFTARLGEAVAAVRVGDGTDPDTTVGPMVSERQRARAIRLLEQSLAEGATVSAAAPVPEGKGWFLAPQVLSGVREGMAAATEEIFAPILPVGAVEGDDAAIEWANRLPFGLSAAIVTPSIDRALRFADRIETGVVKVNQETGSAEPHFPFGGWKNSAVGAHEQGQAAAGFYTKVQTVHVLPAAV